MVYLVCDPSATEPAVTTLGDSETYLVYVSNQSGIMLLRDLSFVLNVEVYCKIGACLSLRPCWANPVTEQLTQRHSQEERQDT